MRDSRPARLLGLFLLLALAPACARGVAVQSTPSPSTYRISVHNTLPSSIDVSYATSSGTVRGLGTVAAGQTQEFVVVNAQGTQISVIARPQGEAATIRKAVLLRGGETTPVDITKP